MSVRLNISWRGKKFFIEFGNLSELNNTTVNQLKVSCQRVVGIDTASFDLFAFGGRMNNLELPLYSYELQPSCNLVLVENKNLLQEGTKPQKDEGYLLTQLDTIQVKLKQEIVPQIEQYEQQAKALSHKCSAKEKMQHVHTAAYLSEQLMHILFDLDSVICDPEAATARQTRKQTVKQAQTLLDKTDEIKSMINHISPEQQE